MTRLVALSRKIPILDQGESQSTSSHCVCYGESDRATAAIPSRVLENLRSYSDFNM